MSILLKTAILYLKSEINIIIMKKKCYYALKGVLIMQTFHYPIKNRKLKDLATQDAVNSLVSQMFVWQQSAGSIGSLILHSCWGNTSTLEKRYQGEYTSNFVSQMRTLRRLYDISHNKKWRIMMNSMASELLYLQESNGGFIHATAEFEPCFSTEHGCPIHWFNPIIALCEYYTWEYAEEDIKASIPEAVDKHWEWSLKKSWQNGNTYTGRLNHAGWCGVTNQDLVAIHAIVLSAKLFGKEEKYEKYAKPALDYIFENNYYEALGLFERGDQPNFAERTAYYDVILPTLEKLYELLGEKRLLDAYDNVTSHLFDAAFVDEKGFTHLKRGAITDACDKTVRLGWEDGAIATGTYFALSGHMEKYLKRHPDAEKEKIKEALLDTVAAYVLADGNFPRGVFNPNPLFHIAGGAISLGWLNKIMDILGSDLKEPEIVDIPCTHRKNQNFVWKQNGRVWAIEIDGVRSYGGYTRYPAGITVGPEEPLIMGDFESLENPEIIEIIE